MNASKKPRRLLRFSLRTLLLLTAVAACWLGFQVNQAQKRRAAIAAIEQARGIIIYDDMWVGRNPYKDQPQTRYGFAYMCERVLGEDFARNVSVVELIAVEGEVVGDLVAKLLACQSFPPWV